MGCTAALEPLLLLLLLQAARMMSELGREGTCYKIEGRVESEKAGNHLSHQPFFASDL